MTEYHLAQLNVGRPRGPADSTVMAGFMALINPVNDLADLAPGFIWRLEDGDGPGATALRPCGPDIMVNMSVWATLEALQDFVYRNGPHLDAMRRRREWFHKMAEQHLVLWWIPAGHLPGIDEALHRLGLLRSYGPGPLAFTFREPYDPPVLDQPPYHGILRTGCGDGPTDVISLNTSGLHCGEQQALADAEVAH